LRKEVRFYVITGGPGVGKTSLVSELNKFGFLTVPEDARKIIKEQIKIGGEGFYFATVARNLGNRHGKKTNMGRSSVFR